MQNDAIDYNKLKLSHKEAVSLGAGGRSGGRLQYMLDDSDIGLRVQS